MEGLGRASEALDESDDEVFTTEPILKGAPWNAARTGSKDTGSNVGEDGRASAPELNVEVQALAASGDDPSSGGPYLQEKEVIHRSGFFPREGRMLLCQQSSGPCCVKLCQQSSGRCRANVETHIDKSVDRFPT